jgi:prepilin-type processing-associated H-X9-DG protein
MPNSTNFNFRNAVGILPSGEILFAMSKQKVTFHELASYFHSSGCVNALYLDGFVSRMYVPSLNLAQMDGDLGPIIAIWQ